MADMHSAIRQKSYFYVFAHQTSNGDFPQVTTSPNFAIRVHPDFDKARRLRHARVFRQNWGSIHGEELAYVFGMPLVGGTNHLTMNYTRAEMLLSEMVITYWTNFARTGYRFIVLLCCRQQ
jgi:neuroligin